MGQSHVPSVFFLLSKLKHKLNNQVSAGLKRDDELAISNLRPQDTENMKKSICKVFKSYNLGITIKANIKKVNF